MLFFCVNNIFLNIVFNNSPIYRDKYSILLKEVIEFLYNILIYKNLYFLYQFNKVLFYIVLQYSIIIFAVFVVYYMVQQESIQVLLLSVYKVNYSFILYIQVNIILILLQIGQRHSKYSQGLIMICIRQLLHRSC